MEPYSTSQFLVRDGALMPHCFRRESLWFTEGVNRSPRFSVPLAPSALFVFRFSILGVLPHSPFPWKRTFFLTFGTFSFLVLSQSPFRQLSGFPPSPGSPQFSRIPPGSWYRYSSRHTRAWVGSEPCFFALQNLALLGQQARLRGYLPLRNPTVSAAS